MKKLQSFMLQMALGFGVISGAQVQGAASEPVPLTLPRNKTLRFTGTTPSEGMPCSVTLSTRADGNIVYLGMEGAFSGRSFGTPTGLEPTSHGYIGTIDFLKGIATGEIYLEPHVFRPGLTLSWNSNEMPPHLKEMGFFGSTLESTSRIVFKEQSLLLQLKGECQDLRVEVENRF